MRKRSSCNSPLYKRLLRKSDHSLNGGVSIGLSRACFRHATARSQTLSSLEHATLKIHALNPIRIASKVGSPISLAINTTRQVLWTIFSSSTKKVIPFTLFIKLTNWLIANFLFSHFLLSDSTKGPRILHRINKTSWAWL